MAEVVEFARLVLQCGSQRSLASAPNLLNRFGGFGVRVIPFSPLRRLIQADCLDFLATVPDAPIDAVVTDPPYGISFLGRAWDGLGELRQFQA